MARPAPGAGAAQGAPTGRAAASSPLRGFADLYVVVQTIGRGSFGEVVKVRRRRDGKELVCKVLRYGAMKEKERQLVVSEVNILRELRHPNIVRYYDRVIDKRSAKLYILMEYCQGGDLGAHIKRKKREHSCFEENRIWRALAQLLQAFEECHLHREGDHLRPILHRDIKPCNILLDGTGNIKVGDFGLAKELSAGDQFATTNVGTPYYMSPELINERRYNEKSDIWALGCLIYEMAALRPPFEALNVVALGKKISAGRFARIPSRYSDDLQYLIERMLTLNPLRRPSVTQLMDHPRLARYLARSPTSVQRASAEPGTPSASAEPAERSGAQSAAIEEYLAAKLKDLQSRQDELRRLEKSLQVREQDILFREKLLARRERDIEAQARRLARHSPASYSHASSGTSSTGSGPTTSTDPARIHVTPRPDRERDDFSRAQSVDDIISAAAAAAKRTPFKSILYPGSADFRGVENISPSGDARHRVARRPFAANPAKGDAAGGSPSLRRPLFR